MNLLYGLMTGSAILHIVIPIGAYVLFSTMNSILSYNPLVFIGICVSVSFLAQMVMLTILQVHTCDGVNNVIGILKGGAIAALITGGIIAIPVFVEPMRLMVSQLAVKHIPILPPDIQHIHTMVASTVKRFMPGGATDPLEKEEAPITKEGYEEQTLLETMFGACFWSGFAGAYGVGFGSLTAASCPPVASEPLGASAP